MVNGSWIPRMSARNVDLEGCDQKPGEQEAVSGSPATQEPRRPGDREEGHDAEAQEIRQGTRRGVERLASREVGIHQDENPVIENDGERDEDGSQVLLDGHPHGPPLAHPVHSLQGCSTRR
jgi:hypothetical protein